MLTPLVRSKLLRLTNSPNILKGCQAFILSVRGVCKSLHPTLPNIPKGCQGVKGCLGCQACNRFGTFSYTEKVGLLLSKEQKKVILYRIISFLCSLLSIINSQNNVSLMRLAIYIKKGCENKDALFVSTGLLLPVSIFCFRIILWHKNLNILFFPICGYPVCNRVLELLFLFYLPTFLIFCYISRKDLLFYSYLYKRVPYLFKYLYILGRIELYFCNNFFVGLLCLTILLFFYLFLSNVDSFLIHVRLLLLIPYSAFGALLLQNFVENHKNVLHKRAKTKLLAIKKILQKEKTIESQYPYALSYIVLFALFYRWEISMGEHIKITENYCNLCLESIREKIKNGAFLNDTIIYEKLKDKKENIFTSLKKKLFLYKASSYVFGFFQGQEFEEIHKEIQKVDEKIG